MKFSKIEEKDNRLMKRKDVTVNIDYESRSTPSKAELQLALSKHFSAEPEKVEIKKILTSTGKSEGIALAKIWDEKRITEAKKEEKPAGE